MITYGVLPISTVVWDAAKKELQSGHRKGLPSLLMAVAWLSNPGSLNSRMRICLWVMVLEYDTLKWYGIICCYPSCSSFMNWQMSKQVRWNYMLGKYCFNMLHKLWLCFDAVFKVRRWRSSSGAHSWLWSFLGTLQGQYERVGRERKPCVGTHHGGFWALWEALYCLHRTSLGRAGARLYHWCHQGASCLGWQLNWRYGILHPAQ